MILKTLAYESGGTLLKSFLKQQNLYENFGSLKVNIGFLAKKFTQGCQRRISRVQCNLFEKKMIKVNFTVCGFFKTLCDFLNYDRRISPGCQNHNLDIKSKNLGRSLLSQMFLQNNFRFWAEELGNLAENHWQGCQNPIHLVRSNTFTATFSMQVFKNFNLSGLVVKFPWQQGKNIFRVDKCAEKCLEEQIKEKLISKEKSY